MVAREIPAIGLRNVGRYLNEYLFVPRVERLASQSVSVAFSYTSGATGPAGPVHVRQTTSVSYIAELRPSPAGHLASCLQGIGYQATLCLGYRPAGGTVHPIYSSGETRRPS